MRSNKRRTITAVAVSSMLSVALTSALVVVPSAPTALAATVAGKLPTEDPANWTPNVLDGQVNTVWAFETDGNAGNGPDKVVIGGTFTQIQNATVNGGATFDQAYLAAFDARTGVIDTAFDPVLSGSSSEVDVVIPSADPATFFVGGDFNQVDGQNRRKLAELSLSDGTATSFNVQGFNGRVRDLRLVGTELYVGGLFTTVGPSSVPRTYLASVDADTGALTGEIDLAISGLHNGGTGKVIKMDVTPDGSRLLITGNFTEIDGQPREQLALVDLSTSPDTLSGWRTDYYTATCASAFDSYMRDLDISEDGTWAVISTTGAYRPFPSACDTIARFELTSEVAGLQPTWISVTGGDTSYAVEIHDGAVYFGGHMRWVNNAIPSRGDRHGPGGVFREGMGALDPTTGLPLSWNPTRERGIGLFDYHVTAQGIWATSDTERWRGERRERLAFFPWTGSTLLAPEIGALPADIYLLGDETGTTGPANASVLYRVNAGGPTLASVDDGPSWLADTAAPGVTITGSTSATTAPDGLNVPQLGANVPKSDTDRPPAQLWTTERWGSNSGSPMTWDFTVPAGTDLTVRLYLANRCLCTDGGGERVFSVLIDGVEVISELDLSKTVGHDVGTVRSFDITSDANGVDIQFVDDGPDNPLINGIEIIQPNVIDANPLGTADAITKLNWTGGGAPTVNPAPVPASDVPWRHVRGAFMVNGTLFTLHADGSLMRRSFDGTAFGNETVLNSWSNNLMGQMPAMSGAFYDPASRSVYYTVDGDSTLYRKPFLPESGVFEARTLTVAGAGVAELVPARVAGMFLAGGTLYFADATSGDLHSIAWSNGAPTGADSIAESTVDWRGRAMFLAFGTTPNDPPTPVIAPPSCDANVCEFDGTGSTDSDGTIVSYEWDFGDGSPVGTGATTSHEYGAGGTFTVTLTVFDDDGDSASTTTSVSPTDPPNDAPVAVIATPSCSALSCTFDGSGSTDADGTIESYQWDFGDGETAAGATPSHVFAEAGTYTVELVVTDDGGETGATQLDVTVGASGNQPPVAAIATPSCTGLTCSFSGAGATDPDGTITSYQWAFGDGTTATGVATSRTYAAVGTYTVTLTVRDDDGATDAESIQITVTAPPTPPPGEMVSVSPARLLETRTGPDDRTVDGQAQGIGRRPAGTETVLRVTGRAGVPTDATAVMINATAINPDGPGFLTIYPCGTTRPLASNVNYTTGQVVPNAVLAKIGTNGDICIYTLATTDIVIDLTGYVPAGGSPDTVQPARLLETRTGPDDRTVDGQAQGIGRRPAGTETVLRVTGRAGVPTDATAVMINATAINPDGPGFLTIYPCGTTRPLASNVNYTTGQVVPNAVLAKIGTNGDICIYTLATTDIVIDLTGYVPAGGSPDTVQPARLLETRTGPDDRTVDGQAQGIGRRPAGTETVLRVTGRAGVPTDATAVMINATAINPDGPGFLTIYPCGTTRPLASNVNYTTGQVVPNAVLAKIGTNGDICIYTLATTDIVIDLTGYVGG